MHVAEIQDPRTEGPPARAEPDGPVSFEDRLAAARKLREARLARRPAPEAPAAEPRRVSIAPDPPVVAPSTPGNPPAAIADPTIRPDPKDRAAHPRRRPRTELIAAALAVVAVSASAGLRLAGQTDLAPVEPAIQITARPTSDPRIARVGFTPLETFAKTDPAARPVNLRAPASSSGSPTPVAVRMMDHRVAGPAPAAQAEPARAATTPPPSLDPPGPHTVIAGRTIQPAETPSAFGRRPATRPDALSANAPPVISRTAPRFRPEAVAAKPAPQAPASRPSVYVHVPPGVPRAAVDRVARALSGADPAAIRIIPVAIAITSTHVRFYRPDDAASAERVENAVTEVFTGPRDGAPRDFGFYQPSPAPGTIEVWLRGG